MTSLQVRDIPLGKGRILRATPVFDTYWRFACARQNVFHKRAQGDPPPWTADPVIASHRFTNAYRASDRVSQFLIQNVLYSGDQTPEEVFFRCMLFKIFNRIDTWEQLQRRFGAISWHDYRFEHYAAALDAMKLKGSIYSGAYIMPSPPFGDPRKHRNHLRLLELMMKDALPARIEAARSLQEVFQALVSYPSLGNFLAFQFAIDLNYSTICDFSEMDFVVAGPGARDGLRKCFAESANLTDEQIIGIVAEKAESELARLGLDFVDLWGRRLQLIDCQNLFCEVDKYARVVHPEYSGESGRVRIKQRFKALPTPLPQWYPPKWKLTVPEFPSRSPTPPRDPAQLSLPLRTKRSVAPERLST